MSVKSRSTRSEATSVGDLYSGSMRKPSSISNIGLHGSAVEDTLLEDAVEYAEVGCYQALAILGAGLIVAGVTIVPSTIDFFTSLIQCSFAMTLEEQSLANAVTYAGMLVGTPLFGLMADYFGRRMALIAANLTFVLAQVIIIISSHYRAFLVYRFISSFSSSGCLCVALVFLAETQPRLMRGAAIAAMQTFWVLGTIIGPVNRFGWRASLFLAHVPVVVATPIICLLPETPRWLVTHQYLYRVVHVLRYSFGLNTGRPHSDYPFSKVRDNLTVAERRMTPFDAVTPRHLHPPWCSIVLVALQQFSLHLSHASMRRWFPTMALRQEAFISNVTTSSYPPFNEPPYCVGKPDDGTSDGHVHDACETVELERDFSRLLLVSMAVLPAATWLVLRLDRYGRKFFICTSHVMAGFLAFGSYFAKEEHHDELIFVCCLEAIICLGIAAGQCLALEVVSTRHRASWLALVLAASQIGGILGEHGLLARLNINCIYLQAVVGLVFVSGGLFVSFVPNTVGMPLR